jgi:transposase-like protein
MKPRKTFTHEEKRLAIKKVVNGSTKKSVAKEYGVCPRTIFHWYWVYIWDLMEPHHV